MIEKNLLQHGDWTTEEEYRPRKMIASILYKYIRDEMFKETTVKQIVVDEFKLPKTTIHRQIYGKKYPGGGQTLEKLRKSDTKAEASGSGTEKIAVIFKKPKTDDKTKSKKGKGPGKTSDRKRSAADIRGAATAEDEKKKREERKRKAREEEDEEDEDKPTRAEIAASKPASKTLFIH